ncbi:MAG: nucleotidyl transferase AbiEii/AbiGii toxin family protein [Burkholderiales bacterium]
MTARFAPRLDVLPGAQRALWPKLAPLADLNWVLYGGTAVALRLGHRRSVDFDFFHDQALDRSKLRFLLPWLAKAKVLQDDVDTLTVLAGGARTGVKVSFFGRITFGRVGAPGLTRDGVACVASGIDLLATKLKVLLQRVESKDYRDVAALLRARTGLARGLGAACALFGPTFQPNEALKALVYFEGGDLADLDAADRRTLIAAVRKIRQFPTVQLTAPHLGR